jgi:transketolase
MSQVEEIPNEQRIFSVVRAFCADVVEKAKSGHPGAPMGMTPMAYAIWVNHLRFNPNNPKWVGRDRFVLSNGHASALLYVLLHISGYPFWSLDVLKTFRQVDSPAAGHPEAHFDGIEVTTGPLGQGITNAVGLAIAEKHLAAVYNRDGFPIVDNYTYVFCGDGCLQEGISSEAGSLAGHLGLGKLIVLYDDNHITIDGETDLSFTEDVLKRYEAYGWHIIHVEDGNTTSLHINEAIEIAKRVTDKPSMIKVTTIIGYGSKSQGTEKVHGNPLGDSDIAEIKKKWSLNPDEKFYMPDDVRRVFDRTIQGQQWEDQWNAMFEEYSKAYPDLAKEFKRRMSGEFPEGWENVLPKFTPSKGEISTRKTSETCIQALAGVLPELFGGSADLNPSTFTYIQSSKDFQKETPEGRNVRFGVREHAMAAVCNGLYAYGGFLPYCSTFLNFIGYALGGVNLSSISHAQVFYIFTHDSIGLGEDGPTHQPIEKNSICRAQPNLLFLRPCDGNETSGVYILAIRNRHTPSVFALTRQNLPQLEGSSIEGTLRGAYVIKEAREGKIDAIIASTGSEVHLAVKAAETITDKNIRVVSMPCWEIFEEQPLEYRLEVFPQGVPVLSVEALSTFGWERYAHASIGMTTFGSSGPYKKVLEKFGFTIQNVTDKTLQMIEFYKDRQVPHLLEKLMF